MEGLKIRWMASGDLDCIGTILKRSGVNISLLKMAKKSDVICVVSEVGHSVNGFVIYKLYPSKITIKYLVVEKNFRRMGIATGLVTRLLSKMGKKRSVVEARISEYNLPAQLFLKSMSFKVEEFVRNHDESHYVFRRHLN